MNQPFELWTRWSVRDNMLPYFTCDFGWTSWEICRIPDDMCVYIYISINGRILYGHTSRHGLICSRWFLQCLVSPVLVGCILIVVEAVFCYRGYEWNVRLTVVNIVKHTYSYHVRSSLVGYTGLLNHPSIGETMFKPTYFWVNLSTLTTLGSQPWHQGGWQLPRNHGIGIQDFFEAIGQEPWRSGKMDHTMSSWWFHSWNLWGFPFFYPSLMGPPFPYYSHTTPSHRNPDSTGRLWKWMLHHWGSL